MQSLEKKLKSFDSFGEPVRVNYGGETSYKTYHGALCTLAYRVFVITFALYTFLFVIQYKLS